MAKTFSTVRELIYWEYAKLVVGRAVGNRQQYAFVNHIYRQFCGQKMSPAAILVENKKLFIEADQCAYCGNSTDLQWEHIIPLAMGGPDNIDNLFIEYRNRKYVVNDIRYNDELFREINIVANGISND